MAPRTRSQTIIIRRVKRPDLGSDDTYLRRFAMAAYREGKRLYHAIEYTKLCIHCKYAFKRERHPRRRPIPMEIFEECELEFIPSILTLVSVKTGKHQKKFKEEAEFLTEAVRVLAKRKRQSKALRDMPARKCLFCCKFSNSDPFEYLRKFQDRIDREIEDEIFYCC